ncbi:MAG: family 10 glycosylhydrolase [Verrucomicrobiales bacterium]|nr:family 10 glycosylhydrolase [Verrucomicrobiales bacterium]
MRGVLFLSLVLAAAQVQAGAPALLYEPARVTLPEPAREFRGAWVPTVNNIAWPSKKGLSTAEQKAELVEFLDRAAALGLNAIILQVRPACDAFYASRLEPWSEYLTGTMGRAPEPFYDPLAFAVEEAHKRGLELHAWFNPFRALHASAKSPVAANHISRTRPELVRRYGSQLWLDPGEPEARAHTLAVVLDVVRRYDIDGVHFDDYFYPYPERDASGRVLEFPDESSWARFGARTGLSRADWRRQNVNMFIEEVYRGIKAVKPWVKFGVSPVGIWRSGEPKGVRGLDSYSGLFADARAWLQNGWVDYLAPQLYWRIGAREQSFPVLLHWWVEQNSRGRHLWPGLYTAKVNESWPVDELLDQIRLVRRASGATGHIHYHLRRLMGHTNALADVLRTNLYKQPALVPPLKRPSRVGPLRPDVGVAVTGTKVRVLLRPVQGDPVATWLWVVQTRSAGEWRTQIFPGSLRAVTLDGPMPDVIGVRQVDRFLNSSPVVSYRLKAVPGALPKPARLERGHGAELLRRGN